MKLIETLTVAACMAASLASAQKEDDTKEYAATYDAVPYPDADGFGLKGSYALWKYSHLTNSFFIVFQTELETQQTKN